MNVFLDRYKRLGEVFSPDRIRLRQCLRTNPLRISERDVVARLKKKKVNLEKASFLKQGYFYNSKFSLGATPEYLQGYYYLQEAASQIPPMVLNPFPGEMVLDMAAAPGSKTTQMAAMMNNSGTILALDLNNLRLRSLQGNIERMGVKNTIVCKKDSRYSADFNLLFDKVLLDAPCTGNFLVEQDFFREKTINDINQLSRLQKQLLEAGFQVLKKGGVMVYSTCSLEPEENEMNISWFLERHADAAIAETGFELGDSGIREPFGIALLPQVSRCRRLWPHKTGTQGFFIAKIIKK